MKRLGGILAAGLLIAWVVIIYALLFDLVDLPSGGEEEYYQPGRPGISY